MSPAQIASADFIAADNFADIPPDQWRWPNFSPDEIACRGDGKIKIAKDAMDRLQALRVRLGKPLIVNSAYRSPAWNAKIGGEPNSYHTRGMAFDISMANQDPAEFEAAARAEGFTGFGFYPPKKGDFIHIDIGPRREWGKRWKVAGRFSPETDRSGTGKKVVATTTVTTFLAGSVQAVKPDTLTEIQRIVQPMIADAPIFQAVFVAAGLGLVAWIFLPKLFPPKGDA